MKTNNQQYKSGSKLKCKTRDFETKIVIEHNSIKEACNYMGFENPLNIAALTPKTFGKLLKDRYEVRIEGDTRPWFYEHRTERVSGRYRLTVVFPDGISKEYYNQPSIIKSFKLYGLKDNSIPALADLIRKQYPHYRVMVEDAYDININIPNRIIPEKREMRPVYIVSDQFIIIVKSIREAAQIAGVDRKTIVRKIDTLNSIRGLIFLQDDLDLIHLYRLRDRFINGELEPQVNIPSIIEKLSENSI